MAVARTLTVPFLPSILATNKPLLLMVASPSPLTISHLTCLKVAEIGDVSTYRCSTLWDGESSAERSIARIVICSTNVACTEEAEAIILLCPLRICLA